MISGWPIEENFPERIHKALVGFLVTSYKFPIWNESQTVAMVIEEWEKNNNVAIIVFYLKPFLNNGIILSNFCLSKNNIFDVYCIWRTIEK